MATGWTEQKRRHRQYKARTNSDETTTDIQMTANQVQGPAIHVQGLEKVSNPDAALSADSITDLVALAKSAFGLLG